MKAVLLQMPLRGKALKDGDYLMAQPPRQGFWERMRGRVRELSVYMLMRTESKGEVGM